MDSTRHSIPNETPFGYPDDLMKATSSWLIFRVLLLYIVSSITTSFLNSHSWRLTDLRQPRGLAPSRPAGLVHQHGRPLGNASWPIYQTARYAVACRQLTVLLISRLRQVCSRHYLLLTCLGSTALDPWLPWGFCGWYWFVCIHCYYSSGIPL